MLEVFETIFSVIGSFLWDILRLIIQALFVGMGVVLILSIVILPFYIFFGKRGGGGVSTTDYWINDHYFND